MNKIELEKFKKLLLKKREEIMSDVNHITEDTRKSSQKEASGDLSAYSLHMADVASDSYDREFSLNVASGERNTLLDIDDALKRMKDKMYGKCVVCGKNIAKKRLLAVPQAKLCLPCKRKEEHK
jgi:RNA polymerase-binding protein DksA